MKILIAPNTFKESLSAPEVCDAIRAGILAAGFDGEIVSVPMADGGDGTMNALVASTGGEIRSVTVSDPLGRPVRAAFGLLGDGQTAVVEMAQASGLWRLFPAERNPMLTSTHGTGELIAAALEAGASTVIVGIGGSATNDGGAGMAQALGYHLLDANSDEVTGTGGTLYRISRIDSSAVISELSSARIRVACDVENPLVGPKGATRIYGPQKGATSEMFPILEAGLENLAALWERDLGVSVKDRPGAGAAGGLGAGLVAFCGAELEPGFDLVAEVSGLHKALKEADLVITGEGRVDASTAFGKVPTGVARLAYTAGVPVVCLAGDIVGDLSGLHESGITAIFPIVRGPIDLQTSMREAARLISLSTEQVLRLWMKR
ncbi:MAG TPA: glycerate kinase [bacterium]|nr:glycerate kinase [bacterium]HQQ00216.1 glycerate kinase [bacterium]